MNACSCFLAWDVSSIYPTQGIPLGLMTCTLLKMQRYYTQLMKILKLNAKTQAKGQVKRLQAVQNDAASLGLIAVTSVAVFCIFKTAALVWKRIHSVASVYLQEQRTQVDSIHGRPRLYGLRQLAASSYQQCKRQLHNGALLTMDRQRGTACQQHCETVACHCSDCTHRGDSIHT